MADDGARYPAHWEADVALRDGSVMHIRPIRTADADALQRFHVGQSEQSVRFRFFAPKPRLTEADLALLTAVDHDDRVALVLTQGSEIFGVGRYDRVSPDVAEVAFNVSDRLQGRGIGSVLLEHLAAAARERGVRRFVADVLPTNHRMLRVFRDAGYAVRQGYEEGVIAVEISIDPTARSAAVMAEREQHADALSMRAILGATSAVVVGEGPGAPLAARVLRNCLSGTFAGPVHTLGAALAGAGGTWHADPGDVPAGLDLAVAAVPPSSVPELLRSLPGVRGLVLLGPADDAGPAAHAELLRLVRASGVRLVGPESFGVVATGAAGRLDASLAATPAGSGTVGLFCQSAGAGLAMLDGARRRRLGVSTFLSAGHRADVSGNDTMQFWLDHEPTRVGCVHLESIGNPRKFTRVARRLTARIPVIALVSGRTGQTVPPGHSVRTSAQPHRVLEELLAQSGVLRVADLDEMLDLAHLLETMPLPGGNRLAVLSNSHALAALAADTALGGGLRVPAAVVVPALAGAAEYAAALETLAGEDGWDVLLVIHAPPLGEHDSDVAGAVVRAARDAGRCVLACLVGPRPQVPELTDESGGTRVPVVGSVEASVRALAAAARRAAGGRGVEDPVGPRGTDPRRAQELVGVALADAGPGGGVRLDPERCAALLAAYGIRLWPALVAATADEAVEAAESLGWPVVVKSRAEHLRHRLDLGGVHLDVRDAARLRAVAEALLADGEAVEIQSMAPLGVAVVVRATEDLLYGPVVSFGLAGDATDLLGDVAYRIPPVSERDVREMVGSVRALPRLTGHRGAPPVALDALEDLIARVSVLKDDLPEVAEVRLNPILVSSGGLAVLEAAITLAPPDRVDAARRVLPR